MNKKVKTITSWLAAAVFLFALAINVKVTLDDPFVLLSDTAVAQTSSGASDNSSGPDFYKVKEVRLRSISEVSGWDAGAKIDGMIPFLGQKVNKAIANITGTVYWNSSSTVDQYCILCPATTIQQTVQCITQSWVNCPTGGCPEAGIENR